MSCEKKTTFDAVKILGKICSLLLVLVICNVIVSKSVHEFFEHDHHEHVCANKDTLHFHEFEVAHLDFICEFVFSTSFTLNDVLASKNAVYYFERQLKVEFLWLIKNIFLDHITLRGPPSIK